MKKTTNTKAPTVVKSNALIESRGALNLQEQRLLLLALSKLNSTKPLPEEVMQIKITEYMAIFGGSKSEIYTQLDDATTALMSRVVKLEDKKGWTKFHWVSRSKLIKGTGIIEIKFAKEMAPYISELRQCFTKIELPHLAGFTSVHSLKIYENMLRWEAGTCLEISPNDLKKTLGLYDDKKKKFDYTRFQNFEERVLKIAVEQIEKFTPHRLKYEKVGGKGRGGITLLKFILTHKTQKEFDKIYSHIKSTITHTDGTDTEQPSLFSNDNTPF